MRHQGIPWRHAVINDPNYLQYVTLRQWQAHEGINGMGRAPALLMYRLLDPNPTTRATMQDVITDPWMNAIKVCHHPS
ncbi:hypothetical protein HMI54_012734 [Coelomomyces lativittatus]|nr:hypothetical protein HMI56_003541 [Coelomomyces lativittatus]KAJ1515200.1 hypothetical protein HMI54_012734 [Coelomomyces lativittatus]